MLIGAHVNNAHPLDEAAARDADAVQMFASNPQSWKKPLPRDDAEELKASEVPIYLHAPYLINVVSPNNRVRIPSRKILTQTIEAAEALGAAGVIVHGGHATAEGSIEDGPGRWRKALEPIDTDIPILIENTAGGDAAMARRIEDIARLWEAVGDLGPGFCLDTCHFWAAGEELDGIVERVLEATGRIDLVHCNDSRDPFDSRRDRHANLGKGEIPSELLLEVVRQAGATVIVETHGGADEHAADIAWLRAKLLPGPTGSR
jgi:deoxyribonuclease-4